MRLRPDAGAAFRLPAGTIEGIEFENHFSLHVNKKYVSDHFHIAHAWAEMLGGKMEVCVATC